MGLTFVPTPLGNLRDVTLRALDVLRAATLIVAEDTRVTRRLLSAYEITGKALWTYHEHNAATTTEAILERARDEPVAVVTDAGTPGISDPGSALVAAARAAGIGVEVLPGAAAFVCAAVLSGFPLARFTFEGFVPRATSARREALRAAVSAAAPSIWYESPHRIVATLRALAAEAPAARVFLVRELTKLHEQQVAGTADDVLEALEQPVRGECALVIGGAATHAADRTGADGAPSATTVGTDAVPDDAGLEAAIDALLADGLSVAAAARTLAASGAGTRAVLYAQISKRKRNRGDEAGGR